MDATAVALEEAAKRKQQAREQLKARIVALIQQGVPRAEVVARLSISVSHYHRVLAEMKK